MLRNYLTIALRHLLKHRAYAIINVLGLMVGMVCCLLILLDVQYELSYESFHHNSDRIYHLDWAGLGQFGAPLARQLPEEIPEIEAVVRFRGFTPVFTYGENQFYQPITFAGPDVFDVFDFPLLRGDPETALQEPYAMILSQDLASKLFGEEDPLGQTLMWDNTYAYKITGIMRNVPRNTHHWTETLGSLTTVETRPEFATNRWFNTYVMLREGVSIEDETFAKQVHDFYQRHAGELPPDAGEPSLMPVRDIHLDDAMRTYIYSLAAVGLFILLVACVNFTNLATARAATRAREVGVRKAAGARQLQLASQFIGESTLMAAIALILALAMTWLVLPAYRAFAEKPLYLDPLGNPWVLIGGLALTLVVGVLAGAYPATVLAGFRPAVALKGERSASGGSARLRRSLVTFQFLVAAVLLTATGVVYQQLDYVRTKDLGINRDHVLTIHRHNREVAEKLGIIRESFLADPRVTGFTVTSSVPAEWLVNGFYSAPGQTDEREVDLIVSTHTSQTSMGSSCSPVAASTTIWRVGPF
jgi:putative ABC transport system permease protein